MRVLLNIAAVILILAGTVWILQGTGIYPVGFMAHNMKYTYLGIVIDLAAIALFILANRKGKKTPPGS
jgi:hypothetical protein